jgi:hypothetical protein
MLSALHREAGWRLNLAPAGVGTAVGDRSAGLSGAAGCPGDARRPVAARLHRRTCQSNPISSEKTLPAAVAAQIVALKPWHVATLPNALAEPYCSITPELLARTDPFEQVKEAVGSDSLLEGAGFEPEIRTLGTPH